MYAYAGLAEQDAGALRTGAVKRDEKKQKNKQ
jgi:hypothetical protein